MKKLIFATGNKDKFAIAKKALEGSDIELIQEKLDIPEIQSTDVVEIASFSAKWAAEKFQKTIAVTDAGYYINALNGFPGPFGKYINQWLSPEDILRLMDGQKDRSIVARVCLAYCEPGKEPVTFSVDVEGEVTETVSEDLTELNLENRYTLNYIFIPKGQKRTISNFSQDEIIAYWANHETTWRELAEYLKRKGKE